VVKYTSIKKQCFKKGQGDNIMKKSDIMYEVTELIQIKEALSLENQEDVDAAIIRLSGNMNDLLSEEEYADAAERILEVIDGFDRHDNTRGDVLKHLNNLISTMQDDYNRRDKVEIFKEMQDEIKEVCSEAAKVIRRETKAACEEIQAAIKQETPKCSSVVADLKGLPRKFEKSIKHGIKRWLEED